MNGMKTTPMRAFSFFRDVELTGLYERDENPLRFFFSVSVASVELTGLYERDENLYIFEFLITRVG